MSKHAVFAVTDSTLTRYRVSEWTDCHRAGALWDMFDATVSPYGADLPPTFIGDERVRYYAVRSHEDPAWNASDFARVNGLTDRAAILTAVAVGLSSCAPFSFVYSDQDGVVSHRTVKGGAIRACQTPKYSGALYLDTFDVQRNAARKFRIERIVSMSNVIMTREDR